MFNKEKLYKNQGDLIQKLYDGNVYRLSNRYNRPVFSTLKDTFVGGLTICINDTWAYEVYIMNHQKDKADNYTIQYKVVLYDHFGLDIPDLRVTSYYSLAGFRAWFVLQHLRNFQTFITKVEFNKTLISNLKADKKQI